MRLLTYCILSLLIWSCSSISKSDVTPIKPEVQLTEAVLNLQTFLEKIGAENDSIADHHKIQFTKIEGSIDCYKKIKNQINTATDLVFNFESDSICQITYYDIKKFMDNSWGASTGSDTFSSWEYPSQRKFVTACLMDNKTSFYGNPTIEIKLIENDGRFYRK